MSGLVRCFASISDCFYGTGEWSAAAAAGRASSTNAGSARNAENHMPQVTLDSANMGQEAVVVKNGSRLCGTGAARATAHQQNKAYWEVKVQQSGVWSCGVCTGVCAVSKPLGGDAHSWVINSEQQIVTSGNAEYKLPEAVQEGDILGFSYDHVELNFFLNGTNLNCPILGIKGTVFPILYGKPLSLHTIQHKANI